MKNKFFIILILISLSFNLFPVDNIVLKDGEDYLDKLIKNEVYFKFIRDVEYDNGLLYLLEYAYCTVLVVDFKKAKLDKTLFSKGQGPFELMQPMSMKVKNKKVFVLDQGFNGIKIIGVDGKPVKEFKTSGMVGRRNLDVNEQDEIFVAEYNTESHTYVSVYNLKGEKIRSFIKIKDFDNLPLERIHYNILLDNEGNILVLFNVLKELMKFSPTGELTWETKIKNRLLDKSSKDDGVKVTNDGAISTRMSVFGFTITKNNTIFIGHDYGGSIIDKNGKLNKLITFDPANALFLFELADNKLVNFGGFGKMITTFDLTEVLK